MNLILGNISNSIQNEPRHMKTFLFVKIQLSMCNTCCLVKQYFEIVRLVFVGGNNIVSIT